MALTAATIFEVRTTGADTQGGCFDSTIANAGSDLSQQDAAALSLTDVVTNGTTTVTSATGGFTAAMIGNGFNIAGTIYQITARASSTSVTVDRTAATATGQTGKVGGALASPGMAAGAVVAGNDVHWKSGTYTVSSTTANVSGGVVSLGVGGVSDANASRWVGYGTTRGDGGAAPVLQVAASGVTSTTLLTVGAHRLHVENITVDGQAKTAIKGVSTGNFASRVIRCTAKNCTNNGFEVGGYNVFLCRATGCVGNRAFSLSTNSSVFYCVADGNASFGFVLGGNSRAVNCLAVNGTGAGNDGFYTAADGAVFVNCVSYGNAGNGFNLDGSSCFNTSLLGCLGYGNTGVGVKGNSSAQDNAVLYNCALGSNTGGGTNGNITRSEGLVTLTADPFVNAAGGNFGLNSVAGGGAACKAAGLGAFPGLSTTVGYPDIGAVQSQSSGGLRRIGFTAGIGG